MWGLNKSFSMPRKEELDVNFFESRNRNWRGVARKPRRCFAAEFGAEYYLPIERLLIIKQA
jgi:hypothetical protein